MLNEVEKLRRGAGDGNVVLPGVVATSWQRCLESYGLQPDVTQPTAVLTWHELQETIEAHQDIINIALPEIDRLFACLVDTEYLVSLASPKGVKLLFRCDHSFLAEMSGFGVLPGAIWSEELKGTNGIGTCIKIGKPLSIVGGQHFNRNVQALSCTVAPIFGLNGAIDGVVNVTSSRPVDSKTTTIVHDIVARATRRIENRYFAHRNRMMRTLRLSFESDFTDTSTEARVALDDNGRIVDVSSLAMHIFNLTREEILGSHIGNLMDLSQPLEGSKTAQVELSRQNGRPIFATPLSEPSRLRPRLLTLHGNETGNSEVAVDVPTLAAAHPAEKMPILLHPRLMEQLSVAERMFAAHVPILIQGETGVGKTSFTHLLAQRSAHIGSALTAINCALLTGQDEPFGRLSQLSTFTLVLDHIDEIPLQAQTRLLQFLSDDQLLRSANIRIVSTSTLDLAELAQKGTIRGDLYYRLVGAQVDLPPLRMEPNLEMQIRSAFIDEAVIQGKPDLQLEEDARQILLTYHWPGNLRELRQAARHASVLADKGRAGIAHLPAGIVRQVAHKNLSARSQSETARIEAALHHNGGNVSETARYLGISRATLYRKIQIKNIRTQEN